MCSYHMPNTRGFFNKMEIKDIKEIVPIKSYNLGTKRGEDLIKRSIQELGYIRSITIDKNNKLLIGDKVLKSAIKLGEQKFRIIETTGDELIIIKRTDIDADTKKGQDISFVDNLATFVNLSYDIDYIITQMNEVWGFEPRDWDSNFSIQKRLNIEDFFAELENRKIEEPQEEESTKYHQLTLFDEFNMEQEL